MKGKGTAYLPKFDVNCDMRTSDCDQLDDVIVKMMFGFDINCYVDYDSAVNFKLPCNCKKSNMATKCRLERSLKPKEKLKLE